MITMAAIMIKKHSLYCPVQQSKDLRVQYPGYGCPNVPALTVKISVGDNNDNNDSDDDDDDDESEILKIMQK